MRTTARIFVAILLVCAFPVNAQHLAFETQGMQDELIEIFFPKIAVAADGSYGVAAEGLFRTQSGREVLKVLAQRYSAAGTPTGPTHIFEGESCIVQFDTWISDFQERAEVAFQPNGTMLVLMQHTGEKILGDDGTRTAEITLGAIAGDGSLLKLSEYGGCFQHKLIFVSGGRQDRPRFDVTPTGEIVITADGFFDDASFRNVAFRVLDAAGDRLIDQVIPHADAASQQSFHAFPDVATNGSTLLSTWHRCPLVDNQGNTSECDVEVQFASITPQGLQALGGNQRVNDPVGNWNVYPSAAMNGSGQSVIAWLDDRNSPSGEVYAQRYDANGQALGGNFQVSLGQGELFDGLRPEVAILENGRFMIVWSDSSASGYRARGRSYDAAGNAEGAPFELAPGMVSGQPSISADGGTFAHIYLVAQGGAAVLGSNKSTALTSTEEPTRPGRAFSLATAYPNPFTQEAHAELEVHQPGHALVRVFDVLGREVARPVDGPQPAGRLRARIDGTALAPGLFLVEILVGTDRWTTSLVRTH